MSADAFPCGQCPETFPNARARASHVKVHNKNIKCPICLQEVRYLAAHVRRDHSDDPLVKLETGLADLVSEVRALRAETAQLRAKITEAS